MDKKTILVVEDEKELADLIIKKLEADGFATLKTETPDGAISLLKKEQVDAVWLDHYLGEKNGLELVTQLKLQKGKLGELPIFVISDVAGPEEIEAYTQLGVNKCYLKSGHGLNQLSQDFKLFFGSPQVKQSAI